MDIRKLQRAIVDGLEDVKAQNIVVFNTEHLSPLFERVIVASGTSNRQTKSLAASVRDAVKAAGMPALRTEGEDNGEWIIVDCGAAVVHVMQPAIRDYYHLEELWGDKPVQDEDRRRAAAAPGQGGGAPATRATAIARRSPRRAAQAPARRGRAAAPSRRQAAAQAAPRRRRRRAATPAQARPRRASAAPAQARRVRTAGVKSAGREGGPHADRAPRGAKKAARASAARSVAAIERAPRTP